MNDIMFINLTPHEIKLVQGDKVTVYPPSGKIARVSQTRKDTNYPFIKAVKFGEVQDLPEFQEGVFLLVSSMVREAQKDRPDLLSPGELIRDDKGAVVGCKNFDQNPPVFI